MIQRTIAHRLATSKKSVLLLGARQVGKSTLAKALEPDVVINLANEATFLSYAKDPERLWREATAQERPCRILIDEVQRIPTLLNTVQALIDDGPKHRYILTGSSARKLKRGGANLLPGRVILEYLDPLSVSELGDRFDLDRALALGTLPGIYLDQESAADTLETYATVYLREQVQAEAVVRDVGSYARFLDVAAEQSGLWVNYSKLASDTEIPKETIRRFYQILEDTLIATRIEPYTPAGSRRHVSQRDRFIIFDVGVRNALLGRLRHALPHSERGHLFEQWLILQCLYFIKSRRLPWRVAAFRTDSGAEVDAVIDTGDDLVAVECKLGRNVTAADLRGLRAFAGVARKRARSVIVFTGERRQQLDGQVTALPYLDFLNTFLPGLAGSTG
jgi:predicted AAA+ superfamily ATPase